MTKKEIIAICKIVALGLVVTTLTTTMYAGDGTILINSTKHFIVGLMNGCYGLIAFGITKKV